MQAIIDKQHPSAITAQTDQAKTVRLWDMDMDTTDREAIDHVLGFLIKSGARPSIMVTGDVIEIVTAVTKTMQQSVPSHLNVPLKMMMDYLARWLCDYIEETGVTVMRVVLGFDATLQNQGKEA